MLAKLAFTSASLLFLFGGIASAAEPNIPSPGPAPTSSGTSLPRALLLAGHIEAARKQAESLVEANPYNAPALALLGDVWFRESKFDEAGQAYRRAVEADPRFARGHWGLGRLALLASRKLAVRDHFAAAFQLDARDPDIILSYADFVSNTEAREILLRNYLLLARSNGERARLEDATARLAIMERLGRWPVPKLGSAYRPYRIKLAGYFPNGGAQEGLLIEVSLNGGKPLRLVIDSGADGIFVNGGRARRAGLEPLTSARIDGLVSARDDNSYVALSRRVAVGDLELADCLVQVLESRSVPDADGVIGMNLFENFMVRVDPDSRVLELRPFQEGKDASSGAENVRVYRVGHLLLLQASVAPEQRDARAERYFMLDTGASFSGAPGPGEARIASRGVGGGIDMGARASPMRINIHGREFVDLRPVKLDLTELSQHQGVEISGIIGYSLLAKFALTIDYRNGLVQFGRPTH